MKQQTKVIIFNGPPGSGKDTAAAFVVKHFDALHMKLSRPLKRGLSLLERDHEQSYYEQRKDEPILFGKTYRSFQIACFRMLAAEYGDDILGRLFVEQLSHPRARDLIVLSDGGRQAEIEPIMAAVRSRNVHIIQLRRPGCDYTTDVRSDLVAAQDMQVTTIDNRHDKEVFEAQVIRAVEAWLLAGKAPR